MQIAEIVMAVVGLYATVGVVVGILFVSVGLSRVDPAAHGAPVGFRLAILPASAALWPICLRKWIRSRP